ncbi:hypothetical protein CBF64_09555 [Lactobacillus taiwanensis]|uniref:L,D-transpeptidase family protein n=1 Tax=Lactobacillus taiwanensis TaxID=508451 RepID=UPI000B983B72|nr:L,D-transpeptidase family protein [Lactobacillus taiwanensis]OYR98397.1 hypothetical protein CBF64_09555 [Lactobacillus taiwanensis]
MRKNKGKLFLIISLLVCILIFWIKPLTVKASSISNYDQEQVDLQAKSAIAIDLKSGQVLYAKNADKKLPVASMSKLITIYLTLDAINNKKLSWNQKVKPTKQIVKISNNPEYSGVPLKLNHAYTIKQLYEATLIQSANGPAMLLGQAISGSQQSFVKKMRNQLASWNIGGAVQLVTASGLPNYTLGQERFRNKSKDAENTLSASDMAIIISHLLKKYPQVLNTTKVAKSSFVDGKTITPMQNWNWMLKGLSQYDPNYPVDGLKTGTTDAAGACFASTIKKNGRRLVTVVMGAQHTSGNDPSRFIQTKKLLKYIFDNYSSKKIKQGFSFASARRVKVINGKEKSASVYVKESTVVWLPKKQQLSDLKVKFSKNKIHAPQISGKTVGKFYLINKPVLNSNKDFAIKATVHQDIKQANLLVRIWNRLFNQQQNSSEKENYSIATPQKRKNFQPYQDPKDLVKAGTWDKKSENKEHPNLTKVKGLWIRVSLKGNRTYIMSDKKPIYTMLSTGGSYHKNKSNTPTGTYYIQHERGNNFYNYKLNEGAEYYVSWKDHGIYLFHSVPTKPDGTVSEKEAKKLGKSPGSHGCIRLSIPDSKWLATTVPVGTKVVIKNN